MGLNFFNYTLGPNDELSNNIKYIEPSKKLNYCSSRAGSSSGNSSLSMPNFESINKLLDEQRKLLAGIEKDLKFMKSSEKGASERINNIIDIFNRIQRLRTDLIMKEIKYLSLDTALKLQKSINSLGNNYNELQKGLDAIGNKEAKNKLELDEYNKYMNKNNRILNDAIKEAFADIKNNKPELYKEIYNTEFKKHINEIDSRQKELKDLKKETAKLLNEASKKK